MERIFAAIDNGIIANTFIGDDEFVKLVSSEHDTIIEVTHLNPQPGVNWTVEPDGYRPPSPYASWVWVDGSWTAPVPKPTDPGSWMWDEATESWVEINSAVS